MGGLLVSRATPSGRRQSPLPFHNRFFPMSASARAALALIPMVRSARRRIFIRRRRFSGFQLAGVFVTGQILFVDGGRSVS